MTDERTGEIHDFRRKVGVVDGGVVLPGGETISRSELWNKVEAKHKRGDAIVAREFELAIPHELTPTERAGLISRYSRALADEYGVAVDWNIHAPEPEKLNHHAHVMLSACYVSAEGVMGKKCVELDPIHCKRAKILNPMETQRERWQDLCNSALERAGHDVRIDHRTLVAQGITDRLPGVHLGPVGAGMAKRGEVSDIEARAKRKADEFMAQAQADAAIETAQLAAAADVAKLEKMLSVAKQSASEHLAYDKVLKAEKLREQAVDVVSGLAVKQESAYAAHQQILSDQRKAGQSLWGTLKFLAKLPKLAKLAKAEKASSAALREASKVLERADVALTERRVVYAAMVPQESPAAPLEAPKVPVQGLTPAERQQAYLATLQGHGQGVQGVGQHQRERGG